MRTCVGCRARGPRSALVRVVLVPDGDAFVADVDPERSRPGRGAWVHPDLRCLDLAERRRAFPRALRVAGPLDTARVRDALERAASGDQPVGRRSSVDEEAGLKPMGTR